MDAKIREAVALSDVRNVALAQHANPLDDVDAMLHRSAP